MARSGLKPRAAKSAKQDSLALPIAANLVGHAFTAIHKARHRKSQVRKSASEGKPNVNVHKASNLRKFQCQVIRILAFVGQCTRISTVGKAARALERISRRSPSGLRVLPCSSADSSKSMAAARINQLLDKKTNIRYLEIGSRGGKTLQGVHAHFRVGVEPRPLLDTRRLPKNVEIFECTSDSFFAGSNYEFDVVYCDGLHEFRQTYRDVINSLNCLARGGFVLVDDIVPTSAQAGSEPSGSQEVEVITFGERQDGEWMGDVFKIVYLLERHHLVEFRTIADDDGRPQLIVWKTIAESVVPLDESAIDEVDSHSYSSVFQAGVPKTFRPMTMSLVMQDFAAQRK